MSNWRERISVNPAICHGRASARGTRIMVSVAIDNNAAGLSRKEIAQDYPTLVDADIDAALAYAAELARESQPTSSNVGVKLSARMTLRDAQN